MAEIEKYRPVVAVLSAPAEGPPPGLDPLHELAEVHYTTDEAELAEVIGEADVLLVTDFRTDILESLWPRARRLQWIHATSAGVDTLMFPALVESDIPVTNARGIFDRSIAEYVLGAILAFAKDLPRSMELKRQCRWQHRDTGRIDGRRILIVGAGSIGRATARLCAAAGMTVDGLARRAREDDPDFRRVYASDDLQNALRGTDYVVVTAPLTPATRGLFDDEAFAAMKRGSVFINVGRGPIVKTDALLRALQSQHLAGAALDVFEEEPLPDTHPLWTRENVIITAHMAGDFIGWREALSAQFLENFRRWLDGEVLMNVVHKGKGYGAT